MTINTIPDSTLPGTAIYSWADRAAFRTHILSLDGSGDVSGGRVVETDREGHIGRYARDASRQDPDQPGRTMSFYCAPRKRADDGRSRLPVVLAGAPWGTAAERDATYAFLATCACRINDGTREEHEIAASARTSAQSEVGAALDAGVRPRSFGGSSR